jgi:plasmid stabilization system protein ParE
MGMKALRILWAASAEAEFDRLLSYIQAEHPPAARKLWAKVMEAIELASLHPELGPYLPELGRSYRELLSVRPFRVVYRIEEGVLRVVAVMRQEQDFDPRRFLPE